MARGHVVGPTRGWGLGGGRAGGGAENGRGEGERGQDLHRTSTFKRRIGDADQVIPRSREMGDVAMATKRESPSAAGPSTAAGCGPRRSDAGVPFIAAVLPVAAPPTADPGE